MTFELRQRLRQARSRILLDRAQANLREFGSAYCENCGRDFEPSLKGSKQRFCSKKCMRHWHGIYKHRPSDVGWTGETPPELPGPAVGAAPCSPVHRASPQGATPDGRNTPWPR